MPATRLNHQEFVAAVRTILTEAASRRELFIIEGMPETLREKLEGLTVEYLQALGRKALGVAQRIGAVAEIKEVTRELMRLVRRAGHRRGIIRWGRTAPQVR